MGSTLRTIDGDGPERLRRLYEGGWSISELVDEFNMGNKAVRNLLINAGTMMRPSGSRPTVEDGRMLATASDERDYYAGASVRELGDRIPVSRVEMRRRMLRSGVTARAGLPLEAARVNEVVRAFGNGASPEALADHFLTQDNNVRALLRRSGAVWPRVNGRAIDEGFVRHGYRAGKTVRILAIKYRVGEDELREWMSAYAGIVGRAGMPLVEANRVDVLAALKAGAVFETLADDHLESVAAFSEWLKSA